MARESFDKEIQFLRLLTLTGDAYNRQQFAARLGISVHTYDKTLRYLKEMMNANQQGLTNEQDMALTEAIRYNHYESADPLLLFLYRAKSIKASESLRLTLLLSAMRQQALTAMELMDLCSESMPADYPAPDEKTIRGDLKYLEEIGVIFRADGKRPYRYRASTELVDALTNDELIDLYDYVDILANTQIPSVQGYLLRDTLKKALRLRGLETDITESHVYKYHYHSRILDEAHLYTIYQAIEGRRKLTFLYLSPKKEKRYASKNTNPLFERESEGTDLTVLPLRVIYDHQYGRWYLIAHQGKQGVMKFRMEGLTGVELGDAVAEEEFDMRLAHAERQLQQSWVIDSMRPLPVKVRFFRPEGSAHDFVRERVESQGQWGTITEESESTFIYEIVVNGITEIKPWLRSFGSSCEVLAPLWLRKEFITEWKEIQSYYEPVREDL
ncbi:WYL domain-containing protein [Paenibacillus sp. 1011MAR3C5]|uniref:helix-turn-helix transcriptional regulator n=1 Tax=Paenibacillus sp. 1011MAR3C5 TaxID=1675787 RepID=UPI000E6CBE75|nr:WYL domain-containing protein [Paenibacillus sp. 1011MAR3C5]RJE84380.1 WYL domain-containing protein [Paenibacillus sp. 1011MAR3C5]